jgi:hypothetical protein
MRLVEEVHAEISCSPPTRVAALFDQHVSWLEAHICCFESYLDVYREAPSPASAGFRLALPIPT